MTFSLVEIRILVLIMSLIYALQINGEDVRQASHETVVSLIRKSGDLVALTVVTVLPQLQIPFSQQMMASAESASLSASVSASEL